MGRVTVRTMVARPMLSVWLTTTVVRAAFVPSRAARQRSSTTVLASIASKTETGGLKPDKNDKFLIRNDRNDVQLLPCPNVPVLEQGIYELSDLPHVCVAGESNAGKSSMINHLLRKKLARASSVAGKTRSVDMMKVNEKLILTDLPGLPSRDYQASPTTNPIFA